MEERRDSNFIIPALLLSFLYAFTLGLYAPLQWFILNRGEFWFDLYDAGWSLLILFLLWLGVFAVPNILLSILSGKHREIILRYAMLIEAAVYVAIYVDGNFLVSALPGLTGAGIDWSTGPIRTQMFITWIIWVILIAVAVFFAARLTLKQTVSVIKFGCVWFFLLMMITLVSSCFGKWDRVFYNRKHDYSVSSENMLQCSTDKNFIIFLLDFVDASSFTKLLEDYPEYRTVLSDFVYYPDTQGMYGFTKCAVPHILTGERYENKGEFKKYYVRAMSRSPLLKMLEEQGYKLGIYDEDLAYTNQEAKRRLENLSGHRSYVSSAWALDKIWLKLVGFRYLPYGLKQYTVVDLDALHDLRAKKDIDVPDEFSWRNYVFYDILTDEGVTLTDQRCFRFIHLKGGHMEYDTDENVRYSETHTSEETVLRGCMTLLREYFDQLRENGVYENTAIMIMADHGDNLKGNGVNPLFMTKGFGEHHDTLQFSEAGVSFADLMAIDEALLDGKTGTDILPFEPSDERTRLFIWYEDFNKMEHMVEYQQTGKVIDKETFTPTGRVFDYED